MLLVLLSIMAVYLTPLDAYVPEIEQTLTQNFGEPVSVRHLKLEAFPLPHVSLEDVRIGKSSGIAMHSVGIFFDPRSLLRSQRVIHRLVLSTGSITQEQLQKLLAWIHNSNLETTSTSLRLEKLQFKDVRVIMPGLIVGPLRGQLELAADSSLKRAWVMMSGQQGVVIFYPHTGGGYRIEAGFRHWFPPGFPHWEMDRLNFEGVLSGNQFNASKFSAEMLGARVSGAMNLAWQPEWQADIRIDAFDGQLQSLLPLLGSHVEANGALHASGRVEARGVRAHEMPNNIRLDLAVRLKQLSVRLPLNARHKLVLNSAGSHVTGTPQQLILDKLTSSLYGGTLTGSAVLHPRHGLLEADVAFANVSLQPLVEALSRDVLLTGQIDGHAKLSTDIGAFARFPANAQLDGSFEARHGVIGKVDLVQAARNPLKTGTKGGKTSFDALSGLLSINASGYHLRRLKVSSGAVSATGKLDISPRLQLQGQLDTELKGTATLVSMPLVVAGTVRKPVLYPSSSVLAGAAVGTALLGPGLGTALGIKVGGLLHRLFGRTDDKAGSADQKKSVNQQKKK